MIRIQDLWVAVMVFAATLPVAAEEAGPPQGSSDLLQRFPVKEARQGVGVDADAFYAVDNGAIAKYDKKTGALLGKWQGDAIHLDSAVVVDGRIYAAHSNYPACPAVSSVEIWDAATLKHIGSHSLGVQRGSLTWIDQDAKGVWWGTFANYDGIFGKCPDAGGTDHTQLVRFDGNWRVAEAWAFPGALLEKFGDMSNSGGSWGPDGRLYISGHDRPELYIVELPEIGATLRWVGTVPIEISGQGFAFDRTQPGLVYGIIRRMDGGEVTVSRVAPPGIN
ncbi:MAG: hypothetical protein R3D05_06515 [Dongiaceae bacterium]